MVGMAVVVAPTKDGAADGIAAETLNGDGAIVLLVLIILVLEGPGSLGR